MAGGISIDASAFMASMDALIKSVDVSTRQAVTIGATIIEREAKESFGPQHAKGTPKTTPGKPQSVSVTLRPTIHISGVESLGGGTWRASIEPATKYARRIELGFTGPDSLGRMFPNSRPLPYMKPGLDKARDELPAIFEATWNKAMHAI